MGVPGAPFGIDPKSGRPLSDKSRVTAGLLQLLLGVFLNLGGVGRLYAGQTGLGVAQLIASAVAWMCAICSLLLLGVPLIITIGCWFWFVIDGIVLLANGGVDGQGRVLRS